MSMFDVDVRVTSDDDEISEYAQKVASQYAAELVRATMKSGVEQAVAAAIRFQVSEVMKTDDIKYIIRKVTDSMEQGLTRQLYENIADLEQEPPRAI